MSAVAQKGGGQVLEGQLLYDAQVMFFKVQSANEKNSPISRKTLEEDMTFENAKGKWERNKERFDAAFKALIDGGYVREKSETVKTGRFFGSEHTLEAVKEPGKAEKAEKPSIREDIKKLEKGYPYGRGSSHEQG